MKYIVLAFSLFLTSTLSAQSFATLKATDLDGKAITISDSELVVVEFWASWCGSCRTSMPKFLDHVKKLKGLRVIAISIDDTAKEAKTYVKERGWDTKLFGHTKISIGDEFKIQSIPSTALFKGGKLVDVHEFAEFSKTAFDRKLKKHLLN